MVITLMRILVPGQASSISSEMFLNDFYRTGNSVFATNLLADCGRAAVHLVTGRGSNGSGKFIVRQRFRRDRRRRRAEFEYAFPPERVDAENRHGDIRESRAQRQSGHSGPALMDHRGYMLEQPGVRHDVHAQDIPSELSGGHASSTRYQNTALAGSCYGAHHQVRGCFGLRERCASESNENGGRTGGQKVDELARRRPARTIRQKPITGDVNPVAEVRQLRNHRRAVSAEQGEPADLKAPTGERRQAEDSLACGVRTAPQRGPTQEVKANIEKGR